MVSTIRSSCLRVDFTCTAWNQPVRIIWAMPSASFLSVLLTMAASAVLRRRTSMQITYSPAAGSPLYSHCESGQASSPIRSNRNPLLRG